jgi:acyl-CoA synthetase (AMP-forming)/AMP-acid ligase II/acyl carrier protein
MKVNEMFTPRSESPFVGEPNNLVELLRWRARSQADGTAYVFLADGLREEARLSYGELDGRARAIAVALQSRVESGGRVLLLLPPGLDYVVAFFGCLYAGAVAVPAYPPRSNRSLLRAESIVADAEATLALTTDAILSRIRPLVAQSQNLRTLNWLAVEEALRADEGDWQEPAVAGDSLAFLQYTSGSTSNPRGVMVSHRNLLHNEEFIRSAFAQSEQSVIVGWLPLYHDMGLIGNVLQPLYLGASCILMSPLSFLRRPAQWLQAITRYRATTSGGPNFAYDLCARRISAEERESLDLSSWSVAFNGAEPIRQETLEKFTQTFAPCGFRREAFHPCYGLAEATLLVTVGRYMRRGAPAVRTVRLKDLGRHRVAEAGDEGARAVVGCGAAGVGQRVSIVDPDTRVECPAGAVGEIWVSGPSVASGYWKRPEENERTFAARLAKTDEGPFLRTGDLGFVQDDELFVAGRLKELIIIRGMNHYPQDIEQTVEKCHAALRPGGGAAFSVEVAGEERLVVVHEVERRQPLDLGGAVEKIRQAVMERHELHVYGVMLIKAGSLPKTSSGKVQRHVCREGFLEGGLQEVLRDVLEETGVEWAETSLTRESLLAAAAEERHELLCEYLLAQGARAVRTDISRINARQNLAALGLDSLMAIELKHRLESDLGVHILATDFLEDECIERVAERILERLEAEGEAQRREPHVTSGQQHAEMSLSHLQRALWFIHQLAPQSSAYNIAFALRVLPAANAEALRRALLILVERHASLRTTFEARGGEPAQRVTDGAGVHFDVKDASGLSVGECESALQAEASRPFDLERGPVFKAVLFKDAAEGDVLLLVVHHIVFDGWSLWVLLDELAVLYAAELKGLPVSLPVVGASYADFVRWQSELLDGEEGERLWDYWRRELGNELPVLDLPTFKPRPAFQTFRGATHAFSIEERLVGRLRALARAEGATLYTVLLAAFQVLLYRYTGQDDFAVGSPTSSRGLGDFQRVVGCFFNALVLRARPDGGLTFREYVRRTRRTVLDALAHQDYPSHLLAERLGAARDASRPPLFQVSIILQKPHRLHDAVQLSPARATANDGFVMQLLPLERRYARTDLELEMLETGGAISAALQYNTDLFDAEAVERMSEHFLNLLSGVAAQPEQRLDELPLLTESEIETLLTRSSTAEGSHAFGSPIHDLFSARAASAPLQVAAFHGGTSLTYGQLEEQSEGLANLIRGLTR